MNFQLIPADLEVELFATGFHPADTLQATTDECGNIKIDWAAHTDITGNINANAWGVLHLECSLSKRSIAFPVFAPAGHTVQSINQSSIVGELFSAKEDSLIVVRKEINTMTPNADRTDTGDDVLFTDGKIMTFAAKYTTLTFHDNTGACVHTFCTGLDKLEPGHD